MTANQIRGFSASYPDATFIVLQEIAAQLAEQNERAARTEDLAVQTMKKNLAILEKTEKELEALK